MLDLRLAFRSLRATPVVTLVAVASLALGIGANTALFSLVNALMLRPLPVAAPERLAVLSGGIATLPSVPALQGYNLAIWTAIRDRAEDFDGSAAWFAQRLDLARGGEIQPVDTMFVSGHYFHTLGVGAFLGRVIQRDDERNAVLSYSFWQQRFGGRGDVLGQQLLIERVPFTIIGVAPDGFFGTEVGRTFDVALPIQAVIPMGRSSVLNFAMITRILFRLKPDWRIEAATARLRALQPEIRRIALPDAGSNPGLDTPFTLIPAATGTSVLRERYQRPMLVVLAVVALVLLVACANLANLLMARATARRHEIGVRCALGATRGQLIRLLLVESVVLAGCGALFGWVFAQWGAQAIVNRFSTPFVRFTLDTPPDLRVLAFTTSASALTVLLFGVAPALAASRVDPIDALRLTARTAAGEPPRVSGALVAGQVTLSMVVVSMAALFGHSFINIIRAPLGFDAGPVLLVTVSTLHTDVPPARRFNVLSEIVEAIRTIPNVTAAGASTVTPSGGVAVIALLSTSAAKDLAGKERMVATNVITPGWIATYGMSLRVGRDFASADMNGGPPVMLVNEAFARRFLRNGRAIGETITFEDGPPRAIVGVVSNAIYNSAKEAVPPTIYLPLGLTPPTMTVSVRVRAGRPTDVVPAVRNAIESINRDIAFGFRALADQVDTWIAQDRLVAVLSVAFSVMALALAALGIYGVTAYAVVRRRAELGIRMALGARPGSVVRMVLGRVWIFVAIGVAGGIGISLWAATLVRSLLFGLEPHDAVTLIGGVVVLVAIGTLAGWLPAWRASRIDPAEVLRES